MIPLTGQSLVDKAGTFACHAHEHQFREDGRTPFITHPLRVSDLFHYHWTEDDAWNGWVGQAGADYHRDRALCLCHDAVEDAEHQALVLAELRAAGLGGLEDELMVLTRGPEQLYIDYLVHIRDYRATSILPFLVKLCDLEHNESDIGGLTNAKRAKWARDKYAMARWILLQP